MTPGEFSKKFPSLKDSLEIYDPEDDLLGRSLKDIQEFCVDKAKVKELKKEIEKILIEFGYRKEEEFMQRVDINHIKVMGRINKEFERLGL